MSEIHRADRGLIPAVAGDGLSLLQFFSLALLLAGLCILFLGLTGRFLPHDEQFLGMTAANLCHLHRCRIVHFMIHDRVAFGGAVIAVGLAYLWLTAGPLRRGEAWAWWAILGSGTVGFASFCAFLGYGYLDLWHGIATLLLLPSFFVGLARSRTSPHKPRGGKKPFQFSNHIPWCSAHGLGRACLLAVALGLMVAGLAITAVGMTCVFVPQDLAYLGVSVEELHAVNPRLVPLIAHDRAGFGGAVCCCGIALFFGAWCGAPSRGLWVTLFLTGLAGFGAAIGVHPAVGYDDPIHLAPAVLAAALYLLGLVLTFRNMMGGDAKLKGERYE